MEPGSCRVACNGRYIWLLYHPVYVFNSIPRNNTNICYFANFVLLRAVMSYISQIFTPSLNLYQRRKVLSNFQKQVYVIDPSILTPRQSLALPSLGNSSHISFRKSRPEVIGTLALDLHHVSPIPPNHSLKRSRLLLKKSKNHLIIIIESGGGGRGELASCLFCLGL